MAPDQALRTSLEDFIAWQERQDDRYELVDGRPQMMTGAQIAHDRITLNALVALRAALRGAGRGCEAFTDDIAVRTKPNTLRRPDAVVICWPFNDIDAWTDRPNLVAEVLSQSTEAVDRGEKLREYQALPSIDHVLLIEPGYVHVDHWSQAAPLWTCETFTQRTEVLRMPGLGIEITVAELYENSPAQSYPA